MKETVKVSLVTTCKGRLSYLKESILTWIDLDYPDYEIVVVDYDCPDGTAAYIDERKGDYLKNSRVGDIRVVKVENKPYFNLNDARNRGIDGAGGELILMIDSDVRLIRKDLLKRIFSGYRKGVVFFSHLQVLNSNYCEVLDYYKKAFNANIDIPAILPVTALVHGLTGTSCFLKSIYLDCGGFKTEINEKGYGFDDREFYLRYLNYFFYHFFFPPPYREKSPAKALDGVLNRFHCFRENDFREMENTEEEKEEFYSIGGIESKDANRGFILSFFNHFPREIGLEARDDIPGNSRCLQLLKRIKVSPIPIETWFVEWYLLRCGEDAFHRGELEDSRRHLQKLIKMKELSRTASRFFRPKAHIYLGKVYQLLGKKGKSHYLKGIGLLKRKRGKNGSDLLTIGSALVELGDSRGAEQWLKRVQSEEKISLDIKASSCFLLGDILQERGDGSWRDRYRDGLRILEGKRNKKVTDIYKIASLYKRLEDFDRAGELFLGLIEKTSHFHTLSGIYFHLGEMAYRREQFSTAAGYFEKCIGINPYHAKAREYSLRRGAIKSG